MTPDNLANLCKLVLISARDLNIISAKKGSSPAERKRRRAFRHYAIEN